MKLLANIVGAVTLFTASVLAQGVPDIDFQRVRIQLDGREYEIHTFEQKEPQRIVFYSPLFLFVERPNRYGTNLEVVSANRTTKGLNAIFVDFLVTSTTIETEIRKVLQLSEADRLEPIPFYALDVKLKLPKSGRWIRARNPHVGDMGAFGQLVRIGFLVNRADAEEIQANVFDPGIQVRVRIDYFSIKAFENVVTSRWRYVFPDGALDELFQEKDEIVMTEYQLYQLLGKAYREQKIKGVVSDERSLPDVLSKIGLLKADFDVVSASEVPAELISRYDPSDALTGAENSVPDRVRSEDQLARSDNSSPARSSVRLFKVRRNELEKINQTVLDLTTFQKGVSSPVIVRNTKRDRIISRDISVSTPQGYERRQTRGAPVVSDNSAGRRWSIGNVEVIRPTEGKIMVVKAGLKSAFTIPMNGTEQIKNVANATAEGCVKIVLENRTAQTVSTFCISTTTLGLRYQRMEISDLQIEAILRPGQLKFQKIGGTIGSVKNFVAVGQDLFRVMSRDPNDSQMVRITYRSGATSRMEIPNL